jgi:4-hydroxy-tetrahydrodipicolinate reductase
LPGEAFKKYIPLLMETQLPVVTGSTGFEWPNHIHQDLIKRGASWIYASNFSMGVAIMGRFLQQLTKASQLFTTYQVSIHEVHHTKKLDAPSGTALSMQQWLNLPCSVTSERTGDVIGYHELVFDTGKEKLKLSHEALDRKLFAEGALWAAQYLINNPKPGLHSFQDIMEKNL